MDQVAIPFLLTMVVFCIVTIIIAGFILPSSKDIPRDSAWPLGRNGMFVWRQGFTVVIIVCCLVILYSTLLVSAGPGLRHSPDAGTRNTMTQIDTAFLNYYTEYGKPPPDRDQAGLIKNLIDDNPRGIAFLSLRSQEMNAKGQALDDWGKPFTITVIDAQHLRIFSAGPDREWQTPDDIQYDSSAEVHPPAKRSVLKAKQGHL